MPSIPTCLITEIGAYRLFEPVVVESAEVGRPADNLVPGGKFGAAGANLYRAAHHLFTLAFALRFGAAETRHEGDRLPGEFLRKIFGLDSEEDGAQPFTAATAIVLGDKLEDGSRKGTVVCGPDAITVTEEGKWRVFGGNVMPDEIIPAAGSVVPSEQRLFYNQGLPMRTVADTKEAAGIWRSVCGFSESLAARTAETLRWEVPEEGAGLTLPVCRGGVFRLVFPDPERCAAGAGPGSGAFLDFECRRGAGCESSLPGLLPYRKTGFR